jgi:hypothetical protein
MASLLTSLAGPVIGGLLGGSGSKSSQTQTNTIDPRLAEAIYGSNGSVPAAQDWFSKNKSGMNSQMQQGLNNQASQYAASKPGFDQMQNLGLGLMGGGVAGNPFSQGYSGGTNFAPQGRTNMAGTNQPTAQQTTQAYTPAVFDSAPITQPAAQTNSTPQAAPEDELMKWMRNQAMMQKSQQEQMEAMTSFNNGWDRG